jgi:hypothetical protein
MSKKANTDRPKTNIFTILLIALTVILAGVAVVGVFFLARLNQPSQLTSLLAEPTTTKAQINLSEPPVSQTIEPINEARQTLVAYFRLLSEKNYSQAVQYQGYSWQTFIDKNPDLKPDDYPGLLREACETNGFRCLKIRTIIEDKEISPEEFLFKVEFANPDGSVFRRGPCCGATEETMPTQTFFDYTMKRADNQWKVATQPVYVP